MKKIAILSLIIALGVATLSLFQFERYQKFVVETESTIDGLTKSLNPQLAAMQEKIDALQQKVDHAESTHPNLSMSNTSIAPANAQTSAPTTSAATSTNTTASTSTMPASEPNANLAPMLSQAAEQHTQAVRNRVMEAEFLVRLASERMQLTQELPLAKQLLQNADQQIQAINDPSFVPIREAIAQDIQALDQVKVPDTEGLWLKIGTLIDKVSNLPTRGLKIAVVALPPSTNQKSETGSWKDAFSNSLESLKDIVKIQKHQKPIEPVLPLEEQALAQEHVKLLLEQARWAMLHGNQRLYQLSLKEADNWLNSHFETADPEVQKIDLSLKTLEAINIKPELPDMQSTLQLIQAKR